MESIHELPAEEINLILLQAKNFLEWGIEPKYYQLNLLIDSIKQSLIHFMPDDKDLIRDINTASKASLIIDTFRTDYPHPLKEGLIILREIFNVINGAEKAYSPYKIQWAINDYLTTIKPYFLEEKLQKFQSTQSEKAKKPRARNGITPGIREERNKKIIQHFNQALITNPSLTHSSFAEKHAEKYGLKPRRIRDILKMVVGN